jgi:hypothetical protein
MVISMAETHFELEESSSRTSAVNRHYIVGKKTHIALLKLGQFHTSTFGSDELNSLSNELNSLLVVELKISLVLNNN